MAAIIMAGVQSARGWNRAMCALIRADIVVS